MEREVMFECNIGDGNSRLSVRIVKTKLPKEMNDEVTIEYRERLSLVWKDYFRDDPPRELLAPLIDMLCHRVNCEDEVCEYVPV